MACGLPRVFVFNPFAEGYIARGDGFAPVKHQAMLAEDLANLPQFLCEAQDVVLLPKSPSAGFLNYLRQAGFPSPEFVELRQGHLDSRDDFCRRQVGNLRPWAWGPDSVRLLQPLFGRVSGMVRPDGEYYNDEIARLYSKAWSAEFLRKVLARCAQDASWLCSEQEAGVAVDTFEDAVRAIARTRGRGHHRVVIKAAHGLAGHNAIRLWEPDILPAQRQWIARGLEHGGQLVVEPWLQRELDFSVQLEMGQDGLEVCGYTGLTNDLKGQFRANWAEADYARRLPARVTGIPRITKGIYLFYDEVFSLLEAELRRAGFLGPVSIDAFIYTTPQGEYRLKPVVEINPRYTMGRLTVELMKHTCPGSGGQFRLVTRAQARAEGFAGFPDFARALRERMPLQVERERVLGIRKGAICLNDPDSAQVCLATFQVSPRSSTSGSQS